MKREERGQIKDESRDPSGVTEERDRDLVPKGADDETDEWTDTGTEDPAFYLKPSNRE